MLVSASVSVVVSGVAAAVAEAVAGVIAEVEVVTLAVVAVASADRSGSSSLYQVQHGDVRHAVCRDNVTRF